MRRYLIYGAGAIGGTVAVRLASTGVDVRLIARGDHLRVIRRRGLTLSEPAGEKTFSLPAFEHPADATITSDDIVILAVKTQDTSVALAELAEHAPPDITIVCAQNGVESERMALRRFAAVVAAFVYLTAEHLEPGVVRAFSSPVLGIIDIGAVGPRGDQARAAAICADFERAGISSRVLFEPMRWKYAKLMTNAGSGAHAIARGAEEAETLRTGAWAEARDCFLTADIDFASDEELTSRVACVSPVLAVGDREWLGPSLLQSLERKTGSTEVDYIKGEIVLLGRTFGVPTPVNAALQDGLNEMARCGIQPPRP